MYLTAGYTKGRQSLQLMMNVPILFMARMTPTLYVPHSGCSEGQFPNVYSSLPDLLLTVLLGKG